MTNDDDVLTSGGLAHVWPPDGPEADESTRVQVDWGALTHPGLVRAHNEDHFVVGRFERRMETLASNMPPGSIPIHHAETLYGMLVADGIGGSAGGELASRTAVSTLLDLVIGTPDWIMRLNDDFRREVKRRLELRLQWLDRLLSQQARELPGHRTMGTTMTVAASSGADLIIGHVGDSRAYLWHDDTLRQLTRDHTWAQSLADAGVIDRDDIPSHPKRHVLTRALGMEGGSVRVDVDSLRLTDGDQILLCTDGLTEALADPEIAEVLRLARSATDACEALLGLALKAGGPDNTTAVVVKYGIPA